MNYKLYTDKAQNVIKTLKDVDFICIDPPYGIHKMNHRWDDNYIKKETSKSTGVIKNIPRGMKFDPNTSKYNGEFIYGISSDIINILKPGAFYVVFSQARCSHRIGCAIEDAGFELRDQLIWNYGSGQCKAQGVQNFINKSKNINNKKYWIDELNGFKTPQLMPTYETIWLGQKPKDGTFVSNYIKYNVGLVDFRDKCYKNTFFHKKPNKQERSDANNHPTQKPVNLLIDLIKIFCPENGTVLDCFCGSGTTGVACVKTNRNFIGVDKNEKWVLTTKNRIEKEINVFFD